MAVDERDFLGMLYAGWSKTGDEHTYWMTEEVVNVPGKNKIYAVTVDPETGEETKKLIASFVPDEAAAFITAAHGSFGDVYRRVLEAFDEADGLDLELDKQIESVAVLCVEIDELRAENDRFRSDIQDRDLRLMTAEGEAEYWKEQAGAG